MAYLKNKVYDFLLLSELGQDKSIPSTCEKLCLKSEDNIADFVANFSSALNSLDKYDHNGGLKLLQLVLPQNNSEILIDFLSECLRIIGRLDKEGASKFVSFLNFSVDAMLKNVILKNWTAVDGFHHLTQFIERSNNFLSSGKMSCHISKRHFSP